MTRWTICLAAIAALFTSTTELEAQRKAPLRNMIRNIGHGWNGGHQFRNSGYTMSYDTPSSAQTSEFQQANKQPTLASGSTAGGKVIPYMPGQNSIWNQQQNDPKVQPIKSQVSIQPWKSVLGDLNNSQFNGFTPNRLQPYTSPKPNPNAIQLKHGGNFKVPGQSVEWKSQQ